MNRTILALAAIAASTFTIPAGSQPVTSAPPIRADVVGERLQDIEKALEESRSQDNSLQEKASELAREVAELRSGLIRAARVTQEREAAVAELQARLAELDEEEKAKAEALIGRRQRLAELLGALERMARLPPEAMFALPATPQDTLRSAILLRAAVPQLEGQAKALRQEIESLAVVREDILAKRADQQAETQALGEERARLGALLARKATIEKQTLAERQKAATTAKALASEATDLRELLASIEADRKAREAEARRVEVAAAAARVAEAEATARREKAQASQRPAASRNETSAPPLESAAATVQPRMAALGSVHPGTFSQAQGRLAFPAQGRMVQTFGERLSTGGEARGITLETQPAAQIVAPYDGHVVFAGPFRDYGLLLIIEHGEGYHMLLAGFERIDSAVSQTLLAGEPVGVMARPTEGNPRLYIELRHNGRPINPLPWLATPIGKVSG